jgi:hypothetical protein
VEVGWLNLEVDWLNVEVGWLNVEVGWLYVEVGWLKVIFSHILPLLSGRVRLVAEVISMQNVSA